MSIRTQLLNLARIIADECEHNAPLRSKLVEILGSPAKRKAASTLNDVGMKGRPHRRSAAVLDPLDVAKEGDRALRDSLSALDVEQLKDIVAEFGMDPSKLVMKWKEAGRIVDHIVETALQRASKGAAFRA